MIDGDGKSGEEEGEDHAVQGHAGHHQPDGLPRGEDGEAQALRPRPQQQDTLDPPPPQRRGQTQEHAHLRNLTQTLDPVGCAGCKAGLGGISEEQEGEIIKKRTHQ